MPIKLIVRVPRGSTVEVSDHAFTRSKIVIGRSPDCDLVLPGDEVRVSRQHVRMEALPTGYQLVDLGSRNGTLLNNALIEPASTHPLKPGDVVRMGTVEVLVDSMDAGAGTAARKSAGTSGRAPAVAPAGMPMEAVAAVATPANPLEMVALAAFQNLSQYFTGKSEFSDPVQIKLFAEMIRVSLDAMLEGLFRILAARKDFEGEFDASVTMAFQRQGNPLKQASDMGAFKRYPLDWTSGATPLEIHDALQRAVNDISQHQVGLLAGMQDVLGAIVRKLDPAEIEKHAEGGLFKGSKEKAAWKAYQQTYSEFLSESSKLFNDLIYPNLQKGYLMSHKEKTAILESAVNLARKAEQAEKAASESLSESDTGIKTG
ncbi:MAG: FHA domain-containing protein [Planctomycetes bacterium]|nr:FHA domain-containing protein [Planctomycetota bacterium]